MKDTLNSELHDNNAAEFVYSWSDGRSFSVGGWSIDLYRTPDGRWVQHFQNGPGAIRDGEVATWYFEPLSAEKAKSFLRACEQHHLIERYFPWKNPATDENAARECGLKVAQ